MQVRAGDTPGHADLADFSPRSTCHCPPLATLTRLQEWFHIVTNPWPWFKKHGVAIEKYFPISINRSPTPAPRSAYPTAPRDVETAVRLARLVVEETAQAEGIAQPSARAIRNAAAGQTPRSRFGDARCRIFGHARCASDRWPSDPCVCRSGVRCWAAVFWGAR